MPRLRRMGLDRNIAKCQQLEWGATDRDRSAGIEQNGGTRGVNRMAQGIPVGPWQARKTRSARPYA